jgi:hypothetical protein
LMTHLTFINCHSVIVNHLAVILDEARLEIVHW